eukprot:CAMPEP_0184116526 /NCGR_PEP_ID=MMETSP0974-20121125/20475_1 /TAXON_ID=483370 /ORGANISM="non described non described, Strain CCMP2097" /LENGTH=50 /DNA_ID=CAMNT_0026419651 /DNA_START=41 /DNA_END=190 /DNA_ORIENTATION=+
MNVDVNMAPNVASAAAAAAAAAKTLKASVACQSARGFFDFRSASNFLAAA